MDEVGFRDRDIEAEAAKIIISIHYDLETSRQKEG